MNWTNEGKYHDRDNRSGTQADWHVIPSAA